MIDLSSLALLKGKKALVTGIANDQSIAWGCAKAFNAFGADLAITYLNEKSRKLRRAAGQGGQGAAFYADGPSETGRAGGCIRSRG